MKKFSIAAISDVFFIAVASFFISLIFFNYFVIFPINLVAAGCVSGLSAVLGAKLVSVRGEKKKLSAAESAEFADFSIRINVMPDKEVINLAKTVAEKRGYKSEVKNGGLYFKDERLYAFFKFGFDTLTKADVVKAFNKLEADDRAILVSENPNEEIKTFAARFDGKIEISDGKEFFIAVKSAELLPKTGFTLLPEKKKKGNFTLLLDRKKAKNYLFFGSLFVVFSFFVPIKVYYLAVGGSLLAASVLIRFVGKNEREQPPRLK